MQVAHRLFVSSLVALTLAHPARLFAREAAADARRPSSDAARPYAEAPRPYAEPARSEAPSAGGLRVTLLGGVGVVSNAATGPVVRIDARLPVRTLPGGLVLSAGLGLRTLYTHESTSSLSSGSSETNALDVEVAPTARLGLLLARRFDVHVELGVGAARTMTATTTDAQFQGRATTTGSHTTGLLRLGLGVEVALEGSVRVAIEPLIVGYRFDGGADTSLLGGVTFAL